MKKMIYGLTVVFIIILISNLVNIPTVGKSYAYQTYNKEFSFRCVPSKGTGEEDMIRAFERFKTENPEHRDLIIYRTFRKNWLKFWNWKAYLFSKLWKYPFLASE